MAKKRKEKVVVVLDDGTRFRGVVENFRPERATLALKELDWGGQLVQIHDIDQRKVAAIFFVRDLGLIGDSGGSSKGVPEEVRESGDLRRVTFKWGEKVEAWVDVIDAGKRWMYLYPTEGSDRSENIDRIYATGSAVADLQPL